MKTWLRTVLAVVSVSLPLAGCAAQAAPEGTTVEGQQPLAIGAAVKGPKLGTLASVDAKFAQWLVTPHGDVAGMLLDDGSVAMIPRHEAKALDADTLKAGDAVHVEGMTHEVADGARTFAFASVKKGDTTIIEAKRPPEGAAFGGAMGKGFGKRPHGPMDPEKIAEWRAQHPEEAKKLDDFRAAHPELAEKMKEHRGRHHGFGGPDGARGMDRKEHDLSSLSDQSANGTVVAVLAGRHGEARGYVLSDGTVAYVKHARHAKGDEPAPGEKGAKIDLGLKKGDSISVTGKGGAYALGRALVIEKITLPSGETKDL